MLPLESFGNRWPIEQNEASKHDLASSSCSSLIAPLSCLLSSFPKMPSASRPVLFSSSFSTFPPSSFYFRLESAPVLAPSPKPSWLPGLEVASCFVPSEHLACTSFHVLIVIRSCLYLLHESVGNLGGRYMLYAF